jgi:hypothetical protein
MNWALLLAIWGAILSTSLGVLKIVEFMRDRVNIKIGVKGGYVVVPSDHPFNPYGNKPLISITVANAGKRPATITQAGLLTPRGMGKKYLVAVESVKFVDLTEGKSSSYHLFEEEVKKSGISSDKYVAYALTATWEKFFSHNIFSRIKKLQRLK